MSKPHSDTVLRLGTRGSPLAMAQAREARARLCSATGLEEARVAIIAVQASGDRIVDRPLAEIGGKALWTKELDAALLAGEIDFAVHSAKDVETIRPAAIAFVAVLEREDVRDVLIGAQSIAALAQGALIGTSAPRRAAQLLHLRPDCRVAPIRGNVATRLAKLAAGEVDATLLALAGLNRLGETGVGTALDPEDWLPAPGQAAIAIECREDDSTMMELLSRIDHRPSHRAVSAERALLAALGGSCHSAVAVHTRCSGDAMAMRAALFSPDGRERVEAEATIMPDDAKAPARLAAALLAKAPPAITAQFAKPQADLR
jgi:hydroxymethylbilane synthase